MYTVLVIDDDKTLRQLVIQSLEILDLEILEAEDSQRGLLILDRFGGAIDLILLDVVMPGMDGIEFLKRIKANRRYKEIPVIMLTVASDRLRMIEAIRSGARHYLTKPFNTEDLLTRVIQVLGLERI